MSEQFPPGFLEEDRGKRVVICCSIFIVLETVFIILRSYARKFKKVPWGWDDTFFVLAALFSFAVCGLCIAEVYVGGVGRHAAALALEAPEKLVVWAKFAIIIPIVYFPSVALPKLSILALYIRIFNQKRDRIVSWITAFLIVGNCVGSVLPAFFICIPMEYWWNKNVPGGGHCINVNAWYRWPSVCNMLTDLLMLGLPIPMLIQLRTSKKVKAGLAATFALGSIGFITAIVRFVGFFTEDMGADPTWVEVDLIIWTVMECEFYLFAAALIACKPLLRPLRDRILPATERFRSWRTGTGSSQHPSKVHSSGVNRFSVKAPKQDSFRQLEDGSSEVELRQGSFGRNF